MLLLLIGFVVGVLVSAALVVALIGRMQRPLSTDHLKPFISSLLPPAPAPPPYELPLIDTATEPYAVVNTLIRHVLSSVVLSDVSAIIRAQLNAAIASADLPSIVRAVTVDHAEVRALDVRITRAAVHAGPSPCASVFTSSVSIRSDCRISAAVSVGMKTPTIAAAIKATIVDAPTNIVKSIVQPATNTDEARPASSSLLEVPVALTVSAVAVEATVRATVESAPNSLLIAVTFARPPVLHYDLHTAIGSPLTLVDPPLLRSVIDGALAAIAESVSGKTLAYIHCTIVPPNIQIVTAKT